MCEMYIWRNAKHIHKRQTHLLVWEGVTVLHKDYYRKSSVERKSLVVSLKGVDTKTYQLALNGQS
jgi:hypothetical protein